MLVSEVKKLSPIGRLLYWITEREKIRLKKEAGEPWPWTDDEILQRYRFCNVRRMDDKVSRWLMDNWYRPYFDHPNMLVACTVARFFNLPESLAVIGFPEKYNPQRIKGFLRRRMARGDKVFNAAYMVRGNDGVDKVASVIDFVVKPLVRKPPKINPDSMEETWKALECRYGFGSFMAGQITADLRWAVTGGWEDRKRWAPIGPGSRRGMNLVMERDKDKSLSQEQFEEELLGLIKLGNDSLPKSITSRMEAIDWQNCCCEISGYEKVLWGRGRKKQLYSRS